MFEIEKMEQEFDYSLVDNETADFLRSCEYEINGITEDARIKVGGVLLKARDKLGNNKNGVFQKWLASGRISKDDAYYYINLNISSRNLDNIKLDNFLNAPKTLQKEVMKKNAPEDLKEKVYDGDITTNKEYKKLLKERDEAEQAKQQAETQAQAEQKERERLERENEELANREPEIREVVIEDETKINELQSILKSFQEKIDLLEREKNKNADDLNAFNSLKDQINSLYTEKDDVIRQIESAGTIGKFIAKVEKSFQDDLAPIKYTRALRESADNEAVIKAVDDILKMVEDWVLEIRKEVPETIKYTEVIDHERISKF